MQEQRLLSNGSDMSVKAPQGQNIYHIHHRDHLTDYF